MKKCPALWKIIVIGLTILSLPTLLTSCVTVPAPPAQYLDPCPVTYLPPGPTTNGDVVRVAVAREYDVKLCNADKAALRAWYEGYRKASGWRYRLRKD